MPTISAKPHEVGAVSQRLIPSGRIVFIADAHRGAGKRFVMRADEKLTAFLELETAIRPTSVEFHFLTKPALATQFAPQGSQAEQSATEQRTVEPESGVGTVNWKFGPK